MKRVLLFAALIAWSGVAGAVVYKWLDAQGKVQYGDRPPNGVHAEVVEGLGTHAVNSARPAETAPQASRTAANPNQPKVDDPAAKKAMDDDVAQAREKECAEARERYRKLIEGRRLFKTGDNGERQYLSSEEIDTQRLDAKRDIDTVCNSPT
ncbi:MAG TPA: DUF4124 domain-containing protein [Steroidobacteraceae bacterium]|jgi:hypothetical protein|nr:DUF4124 domain-containing protein [Steroidobacteraceae bacterium]